MNLTEPNLSHLRYFVTAAERGSLAQAAQLLHVSQPAISQAIRKLEENLECELLVHSRNRFKLTAEGDLLVIRARHLLKQVEDLKAELKGLQKELSGSFVIATSTSVAHFILPEILRSFKKLHPKVRPVLQLGTAQYIAEQVRKGEAELGLVIDDGQVRGVQKRLLHEGVFQCVVKSGAGSSLEPQFLVTRESPGLLELEKIYKKHTKKTAELAMEVESWEVIAQLAAQGLGVGFIPDFIVNKQTGLRVVDAFSVWAQKIKYRHYLLHQGEHQLSRVAQAFLVHL